MPAEKSTSTRPRWVKFAVVLGVSMLCAGIAVIAAVVIGGVRESRAIESLRAAGEPVSPSEITFVKGRDGDVLERALAFREQYMDAPIFRYIHVTPPSEFAQEVRAAAGWNAAVEPVDELLECLAENGFDCNEWAGVTNLKLANPEEARQLAECERTLIRARGALAEPVLEAARAVCSATPDGAERTCRNWNVQGGPFPMSDENPNMFVAHAVGVLSDVAVSRAVEGRSDDARELLELAFRGPSLVEDWPWTMAFLTWQFGFRRALHGLQRTLPSLPHDVDLTSIEAQLSAVNLEAGLLRAFQGERAFGNDMFDALFDGRYAGDESPPSIDGLTGMLLWAWRGNDRVFYLEAMTAGIGWVRQPYYTAAPAMASWRERAETSATKNLCIVSVMLVPPIDQYLEGANETRAHIALARAVLLARREGAEAAIAFASATPDPFRDAPLQSRIDEDGVLVLWSVGADFVDHGGRDAWNEYDEGFGWQQVPPDIVWRVRCH